MNIKVEVIRRYPFESTALIAQDLGISRSKVYNIAYRYKLLKDPAYLKTASSGRYEAGMRNGEAFQFKPGHEPHNKGKKMPAETYEKVKKAMFKQGHKPHNTKPIGTIHVRADKTGRLYQYVKIKDSHWELLQRHVWTQANGEIPAGCVINFIDGNYLNCELSNLQVKTRGEMAIMNSIHRYPAEVRDLIKLTNKLKSKTNGKQQTK
jgi:hypothetical protein